MSGLRHFNDPEPIGIGSRAQAPTRHSSASMIAIKAPERLSSAAPETGERVG